MFYDSLSCFVVVFVDIMGNFDVWSKSSITYPFGLGRIEVLFGFALSISLIFVGCDLVSHFIEELMISFFDDTTTAHGHSSSHSHSSESDSQISLLFYEITVLCVAATTLISSRLVVLSGRKAKATSGMSALRENIINNPTHIITLIFNGYLFISPLITNINSDIEINKISTLVISLLICFMGWKVVRYLGFIILLSFPGIDNSKKNVLTKLKQRILDLNVFKSNYKLENVVLSKVHMNLVIILINIQMIGGSDDDEVNLRYEINKILNEVFEGKENIETTIDIDRI
jgi:divalent metal cation (Fe/Co/Zn/Cd) transporter